jgi:hypothetical protein
MTYIMTQSLTTRVVDNKYRKRKSTTTKPTTTTTETTTKLENSPVVGKSNNNWRCPVQ